MKGGARGAFLAALFLAAGPALAAPTHVHWTARLKPADARVGESAQVAVTATIDPGWHIYSLTRYKDGPVNTTFTVGPGLALQGVPVQPPPKREHTDLFNPPKGLDLETYERTVSFGLPVKITAAGAPAVKVRFQTCDANNCLPPATVALTLKPPAPGPARAGHTKPITSVPAQPGGRAPPARGDAAPGAPSTVTGSVDPGHNGLLSFIWLALLAGFTALLTPCVFPMIPITVSIFTKQHAPAGAGAEAPPKLGAGGARSSLAGPVAYCLGIIGTFTGLGLLMTILFGAGSIGKFAANPVVNIGLAVLFIVLAANLFGVFEIVLPPALVNKVSSGAGRGGLVGPLLMGLTFTLTSFTCTVPFVGTVLLTASQGRLLYPLVGMLAFSTAFALPFFLLALFPQYLARLPKSGGWLVSVKATMGFLELAAALKFLSNVDLVWTLGLLTRPVFLAIWFAIASVAALYLLGWLRLPHDAGEARIGWTRRGLGVAMAVVGVYFLAALQGAPLGQLEAFMPPDPYPGHRQAAAAIQWKEHYDEALAEAKAQNRPMFVNFTGVTCVNCREMEKNVLPSPEVARELGNFIPVELFTDRGTPEDNRNQALETRLVHTTALPVYAVVTPDERVLGHLDGRADSGRFALFLRTAHGNTSRMAEVR